MTYRTKVRTVEAYQFLSNPEEDEGVPLWLKEKVSHRQIIYDSAGVLWIYPHRNIISLQQAYIGDYLTYDSGTDEVWVVRSKEFESRYERC